VAMSGDAARSTQGNRRKAAGRLDRAVDNVVQATRETYTAWGEGGVAGGGGKREEEEEGWGWVGGGGARSR
jgi:hypothetical protein